jgi:hypothetical protein
LIFGSFISPTSSNDCRSTILSDIPQSSCSSFSTEKTMELKQTGRTRRERGRGWMRLGHGEIKSEREREGG